MAGAAGVCPWSLVTRSWGWGHRGLLGEEGVGSGQAAPGTCELQWPLVRPRGQSSSRASQGRFLIVSSPGLCLPGKLKEWSLILYGTAEHPHNTFGSHQSRSRMLELSTPELEPPIATLAPSQAEVPKDEEDYAGNNLKPEG